MILTLNQPLFALLRLNQPLLPFLFFSVLLLSSCSEEEGGNWNQTLELPVLEVTKGNYTSYSSYPTRLEGVQDIVIMPKVDGYVQEILVDEGQFVQRGQSLFKLEANVISQNTAASKAAIQSFKANVEAAQIEVDRLKPLVEKGIISEIQLQAAEAKLNVSKAQLNEAKSAKNANQANQDYTNIVSPIDGFVGKLNYRLGSLVNSASPNGLTTVSNTQQVYAYFSVSETTLHQLTSNVEGNSLIEKIEALPSVQLQLSEGTRYPIPGKIEASTGKISMNGGAIQLRAVFENPKGELLSGNTGTVIIPEEFTNRIAIPDMSTISIQGKKMAYVLSQGDTLKMRPLEIAQKAGKYLVIESGLEPGEIILAQGLGKVYPNSVIQPKKISADSLVNAFVPLFK